MALLARFWSNHAVPGFVLLCSILKKAVMSQRTRQVTPLTRLFARMHVSLLGSMHKPRLIASH